MRPQESRMNSILLGFAGLSTVPGDQLSMVGAAEPIAVLY